MAEVLEVVVIVVLEVVSVCYLLKKYVIFQNYDGCAMICKTIVNANLYILMML